MAAQAHVVQQRLHAAVGVGDDAQPVAEPPQLVQRFGGPLAHRAPQVALGVARVQPLGDGREELVADPQLPEDLGEEDAAAVRVVTRAAGAHQLVEQELGPVLRGDQLVLGGRHAVLAQRVDDEGVVEPEERVADVEENGLHGCESARVRECGDGVGTPLPER